MGKIKCYDDFGANQLLKEISNNAHYIDIRVRLNGKFYWFEGDFLKRILQEVDFYEPIGDRVTLESREQIEQAKPATTKSKPGLI